MAISDPDSLVFLKDLQITVARALAEDIGEGDITAQLIDPATLASGEIITRESMVLCGIPWADSSFKQTDETLSVSWLAADGEKLSAGQTICQLRGTARSLLTAERTALNFLQLLSGTATMSNHYSELIRHTGCKLLDTRKTLPGLRNAQKYAIRCGGAQNHRTGLYDAFLIKENHILACGSITQAIKMARSLHPDKRLEIEVENLTEYGEAMMAGPDWIMLDNFSLGDMRSAVKGKNHAVSLEASGGIESEGALIEIAESGVDYISMGALTKHVRAIDLSMRLTPAT